MAAVPAPEEDAIEIDEVCIRLTPSLWLWTAVSRLAGQVLGCVIGDRSDAMLAIVWADVRGAYRDKPVFTDGLGVYSRFFTPEQHTVCDKGSGLTSKVEALNTKWRQRQSGLVRRSCGVHPKIEDDLVERFFILVERHNDECARRWSKRHRELATTLKNP
jgi:IS1 family transposase